MKIAIFGGSFDPVHAEHGNIVRAAQEKLGADKIIVVPAYIPPHKQGKNMAPPADRLEMARLAFAGMRGCEVSAYELNAGGTSYTCRTVAHFAEQYPGAQLYLLVGSDMLKDFYFWREPEAILAKAELVVCNREGDKVNFRAEQIRFFARFRKTFKTLEYVGRDISSTKVRVLCAFGEDLRPYLAADVIGHIEAKELYRVGPVREALRYLKPARRKHSLRVALMATGAAEKYKISERSVILAAALHDVAKNLDLSAPELAGFTPPADVPAPVLHQYAGAYLAEHTFGVTDEDVLNAIRYHTSGRPSMSTLEKIIYLSDLLEAGRDFPHVDRLRACFARDLNECMYRALKHQRKYLKKQGGPVDPLTARAYEYYSQWMKRGDKTTKGETK